MNEDRRPVSLKHAIDEVTVGDYECFAGGLAGPDDPRLSVTADALLDDGMRAAIEARFAKRFETFDVRAVHSIWMKWYLNTFLPPVLLADIILARKVPVALEETRFIIADDGRISAAVISGEAEDTTDLDPFVRLEDLIFGHFEPLIEMWSARTDVTSRVYWSNVGNTFEAMLRRIESVSGTSPRLQQAQRLLGEPIGPTAGPTRCSMRSIMPGMGTPTSRSGAAASAACNICCPIGAFARRARSKRRAEPRHHGSIGVSKVPRSNGSRARRYASRCPIFDPTSGGPRAGCWRPRVSAQLALVGIAVAENYWRNAFFQTLQEKSWPGFVHQFWVYVAIGIGFILATVYQRYLIQWLTIRWRRWLTARYLDNWLDGPVHYRAMIAPDSIDNPDQRVAEDVRHFIDTTLSLTVGLLGAIARLFSFIAVLWGLSRIVPITLFGETYIVPGYLVWAALIYAILGSVVTHWIGRTLIPLDFEQERREADFRFALVRLRENAEAVAMLRGEPSEKQDLLGAVSGDHAELVSADDPAAIGGAVHGELSTVFPLFSLFCDVAAVLWRHHAARGIHAIGVGLQRGARRVFVLHLLLSEDCRAIRDRAAALAIRYGHRCRNVACAAV